MDKIRAEELLLEHDVMASASGSLKRRDSQRLTRRLRSAANRGHKAAPATPAMLGQIGIGVRMAR